MASLRALAAARTLMWAALWMVIVPPKVWATDDETAWGLYQAECPLGRLAFRMDENGVSDVTVNGRKLDNAELKEFGRVGFVQEYAIESVQRRSTVTVQFMVLFDEDDGFRQATGFYFETIPLRKGTGRLNKFVHSCSLRLQFQPSADRRNRVKIQGKPGDGTGEKRGK